MNFFSRIKLKSLKRKVKNLYDKRDKGENVNVKHEIKANIDLAKYYTKHSYDKHLPHARELALECYRAAGILGDASSQYNFAKRQIDTGIFWEEIYHSIYGLPIHNEYAAQCYKEGYEFLKKAEENGYFLATRLHGLSYIHGWGVSPDKDRGFKLIVTSIDEAGAWDKATEIFKELGLNNPEFFSSIMAIKQQQRR